MTITPENEIAPAGLRCRAASKYVGVSESMLKKLVRENRITSVTLGRTRIFPVSALDELLTTRAA
jgi:excisionase family DNA binding protein